MTKPFSPIDEHYQLNLLAYVAHKHTGVDFNINIHSNYYQKLYNITRDGTPVARGATFEQAKNLILPYVPQKIAHPAGKRNGKTRKSR